MTEIKDPGIAPAAHRSAGDFLFSDKLPRVPLRADPPGPHSERNSPSQYYGTRIGSARAGRAHYSLLAQRRVTGAGLR